jgi:hypothetical protein
VRIKPEWLQTVRQISENALSACDTVAKNVASARGDKAMLLGLHKGNVAPEIGRAQRSLDRARAGLEKTRISLRENSLQHATPRESQLAAEIRTAIRSMPQAERSAHLVGKDASVLAQRAVLEAPEFLSGVTGDFRTKVQDDLIRRAFPEQVAKIEETEQALEHAAASIALATGEVERSTRMDPNAFQTWLGEHSTDSAAAAAEHAQAMRDKAAEERQAFIDARLAKLGQAA